MAESETQPVGDRTGARDLLVTYLKGLAMGAADTVPGVSGGTIALIVGIYERLIRAVTALDPRPLWYLRRLHVPERRAQFLAALRRMDLPFLLALGTGMVTAIVVLSRILSVALSTYAGPTFAFFFGLIGASAVTLFERGWLDTPGRVGAGVVGLVLGVLVASPGVQGSLPNALPVVFVAGAVAISGMILPGISGALILLLLGQYEYLVTTLRMFTDQLTLLPAGDATGALRESGAVVVVFLAGAAVGLFTVAYAVRWALDRDRAATFAFLVSLMIGSLRLPAQKVLATRDALTLVGTATVVVPAVLGAALVLGLDALTADIGYDTA